MQEEVNNGAVQVVVKLGKRPLPGDWGRPPNKQILQVFAEAKSGKSFRVYHETLLAAIVLAELALFPVGTNILFKAC